jgi:hypothetical protein
MRSRHLAILVESSMAEAGPAPLIQPRKSELTRLIYKAGVVSP